MLPRLANITQGYIQCREFIPSFFVLYYLISEIKRVVILLHVDRYWSFAGLAHIRSKSALCVNELDIPALDLLLPSGLLGLTRSD